MQITKYSVLVSIQAIIQKYGDNFSFASQKKILELLSKYHGVVIGIRMLNYHLADLEKEGLINRIKRTHREFDGTIHLMTTAICITIKGCMMLAKKGIKWAWQQMNKLKELYLPPRPKKSMQNQDAVTLPIHQGDGGLGRKIEIARQQGVSLHTLLLREQHGTH